MSISNRARSLLIALCTGRGRHAPIAFDPGDGSMNIYRGGRPSEVFDADTVHECMLAGLISERPGRYLVITSTGRKAVE